MGVCIPLERVTFSVSLRSHLTSASTILCGISFYTSSGRKFFEESDSILRYGHSIDVGSGVCLGLEGRAASDIDSMGFLFINAIKSTVLYNLTYPSLAKYKPQHVTAGIPDLVEVSGGFSLTEGAEQTSSTTSSETITESDEVNVTVPAGKTMKVVVSVGQAVIDLPYSATVEIRCLNGSELRFPSTGNYHGVAFTAVDVNVTESDKVMNVE
ncbi:unnamed protein product [Arctogadus glacialis]